jgi:hypothetical protein
MMPSDRRILIGAGKGLVAGAVGVAAMTPGEKVEQAFTPPSQLLCAGHTLERLRGLPSKPDGQRRGFSLAMRRGRHETAAAQPGSFWWPAG